MGRRRNRKRSPSTQVVSDRRSPLFDADHFAQTCEGKAGYETAWQAKYDADAVYARCGVGLSWYECPYCGKWHLTSSRGRK